MGFLYTHNFILHGYIVSSYSISHITFPVKKNKCHEFLLKVELYIVLSMRSFRTKIHTSYFSFNSSGISIDVNLKSGHNYIISKGVS